MSEKYRNPEFEAEIAKYHTHWKNYQKSVNETLSEINTIYGLFWKTRNNLLSLIIPISSGAIAFLIIFLNTILKTEISLLIRVITFVVYIAFFVSIISGIISFWNSTQITKVHIWFTNQYHNFIKCIDKMEEKKCYEPKDFNDIFNKPFELVDNYDKKANMLSNISLVSYIIALTMFSVLFGIIFFF